MPTGDIKGNIAQLQRCLQHLKYPSPIDEIGLTLGDPLAALPILNFVLLKYSRHVAACILSKGVQLQGKTDEGFIKNAFKLFRDHLGLRVIITPTQFLEQGFAERKVLLMIEVVKAARQIHQAGVKHERATLENVVRQSPSKHTKKPSSPIIPRVQLYNSPPKRELLQRVPVTCSTDTAQDIYEPIVPEGPDFTATAIAMLASPSHTSPKRSHSAASHSSPAAAAAVGGCRSRSSSPELKLASSSSLQWQHQMQHDCNDVDYSMLQPRPVLQRPVSQPAVQQQRQPYQQQQQQEEESDSTDFDLNATATEEKLIAAGLLPLPRTSLLRQQRQQDYRPIQQKTEQQQPAAVSLHQQQQEDRRPVRACLWPLNDSQAAANGAASGNQVETSTGIARDVSQQQQQQQQFDELVGTTSFMPAPRSPQPYQSDQHLPAANVAATAVAAVAAEESLTVSELQQQLLESQAVVAELQQRLERAEQQLQDRRTAAVRFEESASARITLLEGRLKFLENLVHATQQQQQQQVSATAASNSSSSSRNRGAAASPVCSNRRYPPASHFDRMSHPPSSATIHTTVAPRPSPARAAAAAVAGDSTDWRSAASAAAAAVVAGLTASPMKSPLRSPLSKVGNAQCDNVWMRVDTAEKEGRGEPGIGQDGEYAADAVGVQPRGVEQSTAAAEHVTQARVAASRAVEVLRVSCERLGKKGPMKGGVSGGGNGRYHSAGSPSAPDKENKDADTLIDKLASRAVEAAAMLEAFRAGRMP